MGLRILVALLALSIWAGCSKKGGAGARCEQPSDCRRGYRCERGLCLGGAESACGYLRRCLPKLAPHQVPALLGPAHRDFIRMLESYPDERSCSGRLKLLSSTGRIDVLNRACGPRVEEDP